VTATQPPCRFCKAPLKHTFADLGKSPLCETFLEAHQLNQMEAFFPLHVWVCDRCFLVQLEEYVAPDQIFTSHYGYFSSYSDSWLAHARRYVEMATQRFQLGPHHHVVELASNDGYLLQYFVEKGIPVTGIEPSGNVAEAAIRRGVPTIQRFFGIACADDLAAEGKLADLIIGNNVLAHVPDINDFVAGMKRLLKSGGIITMEFPHLQRLMERNQFDTIYHEHFSYLSFRVVRDIFAHHGLALFDVEELPTHGGSLRIYACHAETPPYAPSPAVAGLLAREEALGFARIEHYLSFTPAIHRVKRDLLRFLINAREEGRSVIAYGAPGKGNTLLNYCGIRTDFLDYAVDRSRFKHGKFTPGTHIPIFPVEKVAETRPDCLLILPWNLRDEITEQMAYIREWGGKFAVPIPQLEVF
jgi:SAM-dependent methyltransferase